MLPGVCTWCGCTVKARGAPSARCTGCRHWLLADLAAGTSGESWTYAALPFRVDATADGLRFVPRGARWRAYVLPSVLLVAPLAGSLLGALDLGRRAPTVLVGVLAGALAVLAWFLDRPRVVVNREGIRLAGGWRRARAVPSDRVRDVAVEGMGDVSVNVVVARCDSEERIDLAVLRDAEHARVLAAHVHRALGREIGLPALALRPMEPSEPPEPTRPNEIAAQRSHSARPG